MTLVQSNLHAAKPAVRFQSSLPICREVFPLPIPLFGFLVGALLSAMVLHCLQTEYRQIR